MNKKRKVGENWFMMPFPERNRLMAEHARSGMAFAGKVSQLITVGVGFEDWEWESLSGPATRNTSRISSTVCDSMKPAPAMRNSVPFTPATSAAQQKCWITANWVSPRKRTTPDYGCLASGSTFPGSDFPGLAARSSFWTSLSSGESLAIMVGGFGLPAGFSGFSAAG